MKITKQQAVGYAREILAFIGALMAAYGTSQIGGVNFPEIAGFILFGIVTIWSVIDKTLKDESVLFTFIRKGVMMAAAMFIYYFPTSSKVVEALVPTLLALLTIYSSHESNKLPPG